MRKALSRIFILAFLVSTFAPAVFAGRDPLEPPRSTAEGFWPVEESQYTYDSNGTKHLVDQILIQYEFDQNGNVTRKETKDTSYYEGQSTVYITVSKITYNAFDNPVQSEFFHNGALVKKISYTYNDKQLLIQEDNSSDEEAMVSWATVYEYDAADRLIKVSTSGGEQTTLTYSQNGDIIRETTTVQEKTITDTSYTYQNGKLTAKTYKLMPGTEAEYVKTTTYQYTTAGNLSKEIREYKELSGGKHTETTEYNTDGTVYKITDQYDSGYAASSSTVQYIYEYDKFGNHIKTTAYNSDAGAPLHLAAEVIYKFEQLGPQPNTPIQNGTVKTGWQQSGSTWYYYENNTPVTGWKQIDGTWYYFNDSGVMQTGWLNDNGTWYYLYDGGSMATGWISVNGTWYYLNTSGAMQTGWLDDGSWYYLQDSGAMATGWASVNGTWYYMNTSGAMQTGWLNDNGTWYYLYGSGSMATGWLDDGGTWYYLDASGAWVA